LLLKKLQTFCAAQKQLLEAKADSMREQCDTSAIAKQYKELEAAWQTQKQAWLALNARLLSNA
jgi:stearoyl-CoA desaturase (delta-9 desaturase)